MLLRLVNVKEFLGLSQVDSGFSHPSAVVIGDSQSGKSRFLHAIASGLRAFLAVVDGNIPSTVPGSGSVALEWVWGEGRVLHCKAEYKEGLEKLSVNSDAAKSRAGEARPIIAYYRSQHRAGADSEVVQGGYDRCLDAQAEVRKGLPQNAIRAMEKMLGCEVALEERDDGQVYMGLELETPIRWAMHASSVRWMGGMVADLAARATLLNPQLGADAASATSGIVLVDDAGALLHPKEARRWMGHFREIFPKLQLIAATNSPFVLQSAHDSDVVDLNGYVTANPHYDLSIEDLVEEYMHVKLPQRSKRWHDMNAAATKVMKIVSAKGPLDQDAKRVAKAKMDALMRPYSNDPTFHALLSIERIAAGLDSDEEDDDEDVEG